MKSQRRLGELSPVSSASSSRGLDPTGMRGDGSVSRITWLVWLPTPGNPAHQPSPSITAQPSTDAVAAPGHSAAPTMERRAAVGQHHPRDRGQRRVQPDVVLRQQLGVFLFQLDGRFFQACIFCSSRRSSWPCS